MKAEKLSYDVKPKGIFLKCVLRGSLMAVSVSIILICIFAFALRFFDIPEDAIKPINQIIKIMSILIGAFYGMKRCMEMGLITGFFIGISHTILSFIIFSILNGTFSIATSLINDLIFSGITGGICGIVSVNFRKK